MRSPLALVIAAVLLTGEECSESLIDQQVSQEVKDATGVDPNDPSVLFQSALGSGVANVLGAKEEAKELDDSTALLAAYRRADNEQQGHKAFEARNYESAAQYYQNALSWTPDNAKYKLQRERGYIRLGNARELAASSIKGILNSEPARKLYKGAADAFHAAAALETGKDQSDSYYAEAINLLQAGYTKQGCALLASGLATRESSPREECAK